MFDVLNIMCIILIHLKLDWKYNINLIINYMLFKWLIEPSSLLIRVIKNIK